MKEPLKYDRLDFKVLIEVCYNIDLKAHPDAECEDGLIKLYIKEPKHTAQVSIHGDMFGAPIYVFEELLNQTNLTEYEKLTALEFLEDNSNCTDSDYIIIHYDDIFQTTCVKDVNGDFIFEGDYIRVPDNYEEFGMAAGMVYEVYYNCGGFRLKPKHNSSARGCWLEDNNIYTIVGNVVEGRNDE